jgi:hypothetical protein
MKILFLIFLILLNSSAGLAETIHEEVDRLEEQDDVAQSQKAINNAKALIEVARIEYAQRLSEEKRLELLWQRNAVSEVEYREAREATAEAAFDEGEAKAALVWLETANEISRIKLSWSNGAPQDLKLIEEQYAIRKRNRCDEAKTTADFDAAKLDHADFYFKLQEQLAASNSSSDVEYQKAKANLAKAKVRHVKSTAQVAEFCRP